MPVVAQAFLQLGLHFKPWGVCRTMRRFHTRVLLGLCPGILAEVTCLIFSVLEILLTSFGALGFAPLCGVAPPASYRARPVCL